MTKGKTSLLIILLAGIVSSAVADAYKCKTANGKTLISSTPCDKESKTVTVHSADYVSEDQRRAAVAEVNRQKTVVANKERERAALSVAPSGRVASSGNTTQVQSCLRAIAATTRLSPDEEARRKVRCYAGTSGLVAECERDVSATMMLPSQSEQHYRQPARNIRRR